jgi:hydrophobe/amphiphile efflux-1 (HAE1) family protein
MAMKFSHFFVDRPIFASVLSLVLVLLGAVAFVRLPVAQYPEIAPPTITINASYPGANAETTAATVANIIEAEINGVENMLFLSSNSTEDGRLSISVVFELGTNLEDALVQVQNRVALATPRLPEDVRRLGIVVRKNSPDLMMVVHMISPDRSRDALFISNYAATEIRDVLLRINGVGSITVFGGRDYAMRVWLDPDRLAARGLQASDVVNALQRQNVQVSAGVLNQPPMPSQSAFQVAVRTQGRFVDPSEFGDIIVRSSTGSVTRLKDVARTELAAQDYSTNAFLDGQPAVAFGVFQAPGSNALATADAVKRTMAEVSQRFPVGLEYRIVYNPTEFISESVRAVIMTIFEACLLVVGVVLLFLQTWRAAIIPILAIPISLIGTFFFMSLFGFSLNNLSLFGLVLAIGIVVDDAIVVVENVERKIEEGLSPRQASIETMTEVGGALIAIALVLSAVFIPAAFIDGISGQFYRQFALTIAGATLISAFVSLTLSPALAAQFLRPHHDRKPWLITWPFRLLFRLFNRSFDGLTSGYAWLTSKLVRVALLVFVGYIGLILFGAKEFTDTPRGFIPEQDRGFLITAMQLPPGAALSRTDEVMRRAGEIVRGVPGVAHTVTFSGFSGATFGSAPNAGSIFVILRPYRERAEQGLTARVILNDISRQLGQQIQEGNSFLLMPPPVQGIGNSGGFRMMVQDRAGRGPQALQQAVRDLTARANQTPGLNRVFATFETSTPQFFLDIDRVKAQLLGIPLTEVFRTLEVYVGSAYANDFALIGRSFRVTAQADASFRGDPSDILSLRVRNASNEMVPLASFATIVATAGPARLPRYNLYPAAEVDGTAAAGFSQGQAMDLMEKLAAEVLPEGFGYEWTGIALQQKRAGNTAVFAFLLAVVFVFLVLAAQYESVTLPLAVILIVPMCLVAGLTGVVMRGLDNNILTQVGFIVLVGLSAKNAILIVEFAKQLEDRGMERWAAATEAARLRIRPIVMTSLAFILGVVPLVWATGAGAEMRQSLGTAVFAGMIGVTVFGLLFTPAFYVLCRWLAIRAGGKSKGDKNKGDAARGEGTPASAAPVAAPAE